eukprot:CAMPEP_0167801242 /NCGR_PEP_ID=MMETSP0111_2-20121227/18288_1 /TAXON_ID=91324 /ORGANISM="Lotharella globosa, Strain CCCM811" /LENGTH=128 /DNA_ID=CAMNT_0007696811 /DNA_START=81 /DNA_END=467 /DNA_ORIENTATION=-
MKCACNMMIKLYARQGDLSKMEAILANMERDKIRPDYITVESFLGGCIANGGNVAFAKAEGILERMHSLDVKADSTVFAAAMRMCKEFRKPERIAYWKKKLSGDLKSTMTWRRRKDRITAQIIYGHNL